MIEPDAEGDVFDTGSQVLLVKQSGARFYAIKNPNAALVDQDPAGQDSCKTADTS
jgi:hypothetical protein